MVHIPLKSGLESSAWEDCDCAVVWPFFGLASFWDWNETDLFQSCGYCWVFQISWHIECSTLIVSSFRILNNSDRIPSLPLALFIAIFSKAHLTSHSRMSGSRWVTTPLWFSRSLRRVLYSSSVYSYHLFLISSASVRSLTISVIYHAHPCMKCSLGISTFCKEISSLSHSVVFLYFFVLITEEGFLISSCYSLELCILRLLSFLFSFAFHLSSFCAFWFSLPSHLEDVFSFTF